MTESNPHADPILRPLMAEDIPALERELAAGWDVNRPVRWSAEWSWPPISIALAHRKERLLDFLLGHGVDLDLVMFNPLLSAIENHWPLATIAKLVAHGAAIDSVNQVGTGALQQAIASQRFDLVPELFRLGLPVKADGGAALRRAVFERDFKAVRLLVEHGYDVNLQSPDMVFPERVTAVALAARNGDMEMVRYLVEHGADVTLADEHGRRAYTHAARAKHREIQDYLKSLEPAHLHSEDHGLQRVQAHGLPKELIEFLQRPNRRIELDIGGYHPKFIEFHALADIKTLDWQGRTLLDLLAAVDNFDEVGYLTWSPHHRKLAHADYNHDRFMLLCTCKSFIKDPGKWIARLPT